MSKRRVAAPLALVVSLAAIAVLANDDGVRADLLMDALATVVLER